MIILKVTTAAISEEANQVSQTASLVMIAELTTSILARCCTTHEEQTFLSQCGVIEPLVALLHSGYAKVCCLLLSFAQPRYREILSLHLNLL